MSNAFLKTIFVFAVLSTGLFAPFYTRAQATCVSADDVKKMIAILESNSTVAANEKLGKELVKMRENFTEKYRYAAQENFTDKALNKDLTKTRDKNDARLCAILKEFGWPTIRLAGESGSDAALAALRNSASLQFQADLLPVVFAALKKNDVHKDEGFAAYVDRLRVRAGKKQLFGTQTVRKGDFLVLLPLLSEKNVDSWRKEYGMPPLAEYIKGMELNYRTPVIRSRPGEAAPSDPDDEAFLSAQDAKKIGAANILPGQSEEKEEVIRVDTSLVSLPVYVYEAVTDPTNVLAQKDFEVYEDGRKEEITFFSTSDTPFDLVLLIDLSGSTMGKVDLIKKATNKFIETKRPADKLAIVTFADKTTVVSQLTDDREKLLASVNTMNEKGNSRVWDALKFTLDNMFGEKTIRRRRAVVFLTDGVDNALFGDKRGSNISFNELFEAIKQGETSIFPIYLDTEGKYPDIADAYKSARNTLALMANESGGRSYKAARIEDLDGVYAQVLSDLSRIYTIGYLPSNEKRDGTWRSVRVEAPGHTEITIKTKSGYYAK